MMENPYAPFELLVMTNLAPRTFYRTPRSLCILVAVNLNFRLFNLNLSAIVQICYSHITRTLDLLNGRSLEWSLFEVS